MQLAILIDDLQEVLESENMEQALKDLIQYYQTELEIQEEQMAPKYDVVDFVEGAPV